MNKHKKSWLIFGIIMVLLVGGITVRYMTVKQSQANVANEQREAQEKVALYVVQHYSGVKKIKVAKYEKANWVGAGGDYMDVYINSAANDGNSKYVLEISYYSDDGTDHTVDKFFNHKLSVTGWYPGYQKALGIKQNYNTSRSLDNVDVMYER
ncbi:MULTISPECIES: hypothetical protein [Limosilactobacillus]|uniref:hypothetical protein n=1 Tax=Limosilactobacillus TaxID=2742598 RepID=UPI0007054CDA|nr:MULTISPECIES: hypothetical protein [Limosilactobacillus]VTX70983.1 Uncharacterised protein [Limosilactobacillus oris]